ncbi:hypothetical protein [Sorangium sp. So ce362]|uniref:hypothetical protein n=1 Tax=Sorangium sp. So ce362 TaxID=3133303 RepID=UPI003F5EC28A
MITTDLSCKRWGTVFGDAPCLGALVDRFAQQSWGLREARKFRDAARLPRDGSPALPARRVRFKFPRSRTEKPLRFERIGRRSRRSEGRTPPTMEEFSINGLLPVLS